MQELNSGKKPVFEFLLTHGQRPMARPYGQAEEQWKHGLLKGCPYGAQPYGNYCGNLKGALKQGFVDVHQEKPLLSSEGDQNHQANTPVCSLEMAMWVHEMSGYGGIAAMQKWAKSRRISLVSSEAQNDSKY